MIHVENTQPTRRKKHFIFIISTFRGSHFELNWFFSCITEMTFARPLFLCLISNVASFQKTQRLVNNSHCLILRCTFHVNSETAPFVARYDCRNLSRRKQKTKQPSENNPMRHNFRIANSPFESFIESRNVRKVFRVRSMWSYTRLRLMKVSTFFRHFPLA